MTENYLDFEKPIDELKRQLEELQKASTTSHIDVSAELQAIQQRLEETTAGIYSQLTPWQRVQLARHPGRPYMLDFVERIFEDFIELSGDRRFRDDKAIVGGFARFQGRPVMVIGTQKGRDLHSRVYRNFGWPSAEGYRKAMRLMKTAERAKAPVITFIDTPGAFPGIASEERHVGEAIAANLRDMFSLTVPVIAIITGEGGSGGAIGIGVGNRMLMMENAYFSVITPEGCAAILWKDRQHAPLAAEQLHLTAKDLVDLKVADELVKEPLGGAHRDFDEAAKLMADAIARNLDELCKLSPAELKDQRYQKFRTIGDFLENQGPTA